MLIAFVPTDGQPLLIQPSPDWRILAFTFTLTLITGVVFGLLPALRASRPDTWGTLKDTAGAVDRCGRPLYLRKGLVAAQVALSFLLLFGAGLFVRSLDNLRTTDTGVRDGQPGDVPAVAGAQRLPDERTGQFYQQLLDRLRSAPGVKSAALADVAILAGDEWDSTMSVEGHQAQGRRGHAGLHEQRCRRATSTPWAVRLLEGRDFRPGEAKEKARWRSSTDASPSTSSRTGARSAVTSALAIGPSTKLDIEIVGVVENSLYEGPREGVRRQVFVPNWGRNTATFYVRTTQASTNAFT